MKKLRNLFAVCLLLLIATTATAQTQSDNAEAKAASAAKADVNGDGVVNEADIEEIIEIMKKDNGVKYYWYVGQENPAEMESISPIVTDNSSPGWRYIGTTIPTYTFNNPLYNASVNPIVSNPSKNDYWYIALPENSSLSVYDSFDGNQLTNGNWTKESSQFSDNNTKYNIYKIAEPQRKFIGLWVH